MTSTADTEPWANAPGQTRADASGEFLADLARYLPRGFGHYSFWNRFRTALLRRAGMRLAPGAVVYPDVTVVCPARVTVGANSFLNRGCLLSAYGGITIGNDTAIGYRVQFITETHDYRSPNLAVMVKPITVGNRVWLGSGAIILPGVAIGDRAVVAAGAVVTKDVPAGTVVAGIPARQLGVR